MFNLNLIRIHYEGNFAIITLKKSEKLNPLTQSPFSRFPILAQTGKKKCFSHLRPEPTAGLDVGN